MYYVISLLTTRVGMVNSLYKYF